MKNLKGALGKDKDSQISVKQHSESVRAMKNNNSESMWSIGIGSDEEDFNSSPEEAKAITDLTAFLTAFEKKGRPINEDSVRELIGSQQKYMNPDHSQKQALIFAERRLKQVAQKGPAHLHSSINKFLELIAEKKRSLKGRETMGTQQFDQIAEKLFRKPNEQKGIKENKNKKLDANMGKAKSPNINKRNPGKNGTKNSGSGSQESGGERKLGKLLSTEKKDSPKKRLSNEKHDTEEGYSFSAVMSATVAVKQRQPRNQAKDKQMSTMMNRPSKREEDMFDKDKQDDAFIFFRPKRNKR